MSNIVQSFWFGSHLPSLQLLSMRSFLAHGHEYHLYTFDRIDNAPDGITVLDASRILPRESVFTYQHGFGKGSYSAFSNQFRYKLLFEKGGWWVDTDVVCLRRFDFDEDFVFATERDPSFQTTAASCVIKSPARSEYLGYCLEVCESRDKASIEWGEIGPRLMDDAITRFDLGRHCVPPHVFNPIDYFSFGEIVQPAFDASRLSDSHAVHLWNQKWKTHYLDPDYDGAPDSLYARLRRQYLDPAERMDDPHAAIMRHVAFQRECLDRLQKEREELQFSLEGNTRDLLALREGFAKEQQELLALREGLAKEHQELLATRSDLHSTQQALSHASATLRALQSSISWTLTAPLRGVYDAVATAWRLLGRQK
ncbi:MAG: glycosyltransferase [Vicinamibacterales bacterium]